MRVLTTAIGILAAQTTAYFKNQSTGSIRRPSPAWLVIGLTILCLLKSLQNIANIWELVITNYCNPDSASALPVGEWKHYTHSLLVGGHNKL
jgi:hypothetical protein